MSLSTPKPTAKRRASALRVLERAERGGRDSPVPELPPVEQLAEIFEDEGDDALTIRRDLPAMQPRRLDVEVDDADATLKRPTRSPLAGPKATSEVNAAFVGLAIPSVDDEHAIEWDGDAEPTVRKALGDAGDPVGPSSEPMPMPLVRRSNRPPPSPALQHARRNDRRRLVKGALLFALVFVAVTGVTAVIARLVMNRSAPAATAP